MANIYVDSNATGANDGTSWTDAFTTLAAGIDPVVAGDSVWVASDHSENSASPITLNFTGSSGFIPVVSVDSASGEPPTTLQAGASIEVTGSSDLTLIANGGLPRVYYYGFTFTAASGDINIASWLMQDMYYDNCTFVRSSIGTGTTIIDSPVVDYDQSCVFTNCEFDFGASTQDINTHCPIVLRGCRLAAGSAVLTSNVFQRNDAGGVIEVDGFDLTGANTAVDIGGTGAVQGTYGKFRGIGVPSGWTGTLNGGTQQRNGRMNMEWVDGSGPTYRLWDDQLLGEVNEETTLVKTGGASVSWNMSTFGGTTPQFPFGFLESPEIVIWNTTTGSSITVEIDFLHDSVTALQNDEIWMELYYMGSTASPLSSIATDRLANVLGTPSNHASSGATWTTTGMSNPNEQKLSVTFTPEMVGKLIMRVHLAVGSYTVYVDPIPVIT